MALHYQNYEPGSITIKLNDDSIVNNKQIILIDDNIDLGKTTITDDIFNSHLFLNPFQSTWTITIPRYEIYKNIIAVRSGMCDLKYSN